MFVLTRIAVALERLLALHEAIDQRNAAYQLRRERLEEEQYKSAEATNAAVIDGQRRLVDVQEAQRRDNQEHLAKCEKRYLARLAGEKTPDEVKH